MLSSVSFLPSVAPTRVERLDEHSIASTTTKTTNRYFPSSSSSSRRKCLCASRGDDDDTATKQHASSLPTRKTTTDAVAKSSAVDYAMPNKLLSSDLSMVRDRWHNWFQFVGFFFEFIVVQNAPPFGGGGTSTKFNARVGSILFSFAMMNASKSKLTTPTSCFSFSLSLSLSL